MPVDGRPNPVSVSMVKMASTHSRGIGLNQKHSFSKITTFYRTQIRFPTRRINLTKEWPHILKEKNYSEDTINGRNTFECLSIVCF